jgi:DNA modification methylase
MSDLELRFGDCLSELKLLEDSSVDLVCTDPPYGYSFMGKDWDKAVPSVEIWKECLRVLKPGCFAFVMSAPRSDVQCEMILKLKEAGFKVDFTPIYWAYASGFPKASNISKMIDKKLGFERDKVPATGGLGGGSGNTVGRFTGECVDENPLSAEAKELNGLFGGFQPKPAVEIILVAMKPIEEKTYVEQALKNGHGGTWLGRCRIPYESDDDIINKNPHTLSKGSDAYDSNCYGKYNATNEPIDYTKQDGRFPANLLVSDNVLDNGVPTSQGHWSKTKTTGFGEFGNGKSVYFGVGDKSKAEGFSRYFSLDAWWDKAVKELPKEQRKTFPFLITPKASKSEKNKGCEELPEKQKWLNGGTGTGISDRENVTSKNIHPTVKPLKLMQYLVTLGCNKGEIVLDPFMGSGTTCIASKLQGRKSIGVEMNKDYFEIAKARCKSFEEQLTIVEDCL